MKIPRFVIAAASSGAGKTSLTLGLIAALSRRGMDVRPFKVGPDYIDTALHRMVSGRPSYNLDIILAGKRPLVPSFVKNASGGDIAVIEGVMGYYDGGAASSTYGMARHIKAPVILAIDASGAAESAAATALGFYRYMKQSYIRAFILNKIGSESHFDTTKRAVEKATGLPVLGYLPKNPDYAIPSRHLGLSADCKTFSAVSNALADAVSRHIDIPALLDIASCAPELVAPLKRKPYSLLRPGESKPRIAVAMDEAFSFYYEENFSTLRELGAELVFFSPLRDAALPERSAAVYIGGGYPELYAAELERNAAMRNAIRAAVADTMPLYAECGGYLYLLETLDDMEGRPRTMCGIFQGNGRMGKKLAALGYRYCERKIDDAFLSARLHGHVFHYAWIENPPEPALVMRHPSRPDAQPEYEGAVSASVFASFLHVYFGGNTYFVRNFVDAARRKAKKA